ncbi:uncharacterized protein [Clytia hemisphaerica]|uniref:uncharacterized protein n=1 Tax=Clytia hemisphaerica TaxID=252671 RepID=UPI0034D748E8
MGRDGVFTSSYLIWLVVNHSEIQIPKETESLLQTNPKKPASDDDFEKSEFILNLLVNKPEDFELDQPPTMDTMVDNLVCTFNRKRITLDSVKADGNGAYSRKGGVKKCFFYNGVKCTEAHKEGNDIFFINVRSGENQTWKKENVDKESIFYIKRYYRYNKLNDFNQLIVEVQLYNFQWLDHYFVLYRKNKGSPDFDKIKMGRHGNATNPHAGPYFRKDPEVLKSVDQNLKAGMSPEQVYIKTNKTATNPNSIVNLQTVHNRSYQLKQTDRDTHAHEVEILIGLAKDKNSLVQSVRFQEDRYTAVLHSPIMINDIYRFCVEGNGHFNVDTTFSILPGLWLTDTSYQHLGLVKSDGKHPEFPGPMMLHFRKDTEEFRYFAMEIALQKPELINGLKKVGHDLDKATAQGFKDIFRLSDALWCTQHLEGRTSEKLKKMNVSLQNQNKMMADLYGTQEGVVVQEGLADAVDEPDFDAKLASLKDVWHEHTPWFHDWFVKYQMDTFKSCLILSARDFLNIKDRYFNNCLENLHRQQKKKLRDELGSIKTRDLRKILHVIDKWVSENYHQELALAIRGHGKFRLHEGYKHLSIDPKTWHRMLPESRDSKIIEFTKFVPKPSQTYQKPVTAGKKGTKSQKRRVDQGEPELFVNRLKVKKTANNWEVEEMENNENATGFDPDRELSSGFYLVSREDKKNCPSTVSRCELCRRKFDKIDTVLVKTSGERTFLNKKGEQVRMDFANVYLHYMTSCLTKYDKSFTFGKILVLKDTQKWVSKKHLALIVKKGCILQS